MSVYVQPAFRRGGNASGTFDFGSDVSSDVFGYVDGGVRLETPDNSGNSKGLGTSSTTYEFHNPRGPGITFWNT